MGSDGSTDKTNEIVANYACNHKNIRLLSFKERAGKVNVLNRGIPLCKGKSFYFLMLMPCTMRSV